MTIYPNYFFFWGGLIFYLKKIEKIAETVQKNLSVITLTTSKSSKNLPQVRLEATIIIL